MSGFHTRVAVVQLPEDLRAHFIPPFAWKETLNSEASNPETTRFLDRLRNKLEQLDREIYELAEIREADCIEAIVDFAESRGVHILALPKLEYRGAWPEKLAIAQSRAKIPLVTIGSIPAHTAEQSSEANRFNERRIQLNGHQILVRSFDAGSRIPDPGGNGRVLLILSGCPKKPIEGDLLRQLQSLRRERGIATAVTVSFGPEDGKPQDSSVAGSRGTGNHGSTFVARVWKERSGRVSSKEEPLSAPLYEIPPKNLGIYILDVDLGHQQGHWLQADGFHTRSVTVAPIISDDQFPEYVDWLATRDPKPWPEQLGGRRARDVRLRTLERIFENSSDDFELFRTKLWEVERASTDSQSLWDLNRYTTPENLERLVDAVVVPKAEPGLAGSVCDSLQKLLDLLPEAPGRWLALERIERQIRHLRSFFSRQKPPAGGSFSIQQRSRTEQLLIAKDSLQMLWAMAETWEFNKNQSSSAQNLNDFNSLSDQLVSYVENMVYYLTHHDPASDIPFSKMPYSQAYFALEAMSREHRVTQNPLKLRDETWDPYGKKLIEPRPIDVDLLKSQDLLSPQLQPVPEKAQGRSEALRRLIEATTQDLRRRHAFDERSITNAGAPPRGSSKERAISIEREWLRRRSLALYWMLDHRPPIVLNGLVSELNALMLVLLARRRSRLIELARLSREARDAQAQRMRGRQRRAWGRLKHLLEHLLGDPPKHWRKVSAIRVLLKDLLEAREELNLLARLTLLKD